MRKQIYEKYLTSDKIISIYEYTIKYGREGVSIYQDGEFDEDIGRNGQLSIIESWFILRRIINAHGKRPVRKNTQTIFFGRMNKSGSINNNINYSYSGYNMD